MGTSLEELRMLQDAEQVADNIWNEIVAWDTFAQKVVGEQLARAVDSVGANIAEAFGRFHYGEKLRFLYYARGSLFETKYWLNRSLSRQLMTSEQKQTYARRLDGIARQINAFAASLKSQRQHHTGQTIREPDEMYITNNLQSPISESPIPESPISESPVLLAPTKERNEFL
ncbi:MAG: four helix bundle protein [Caldilineae bacterium]|nr:MAG: four helix bundle protein [Caldilineae bacterium]